MSVVTGIMLVTSCVDDEDGVSVPQIQMWLTDRGWGHLVETSDHSGGNKHPQQHTWGAGFNHFGAEWEEFAEFVITRDWKCPENVVLIMQPEAGGSSVWRPKGYESEKL